MDLLAETDLAAAERRLRQAAAKGGLLDLASATGRRGPSGARSWLGTGPERQIRSQVIHQLLSGRGDLDESFDTPAAVRLRGAGSSVVARVPREGTTRISPAGGDRGRDVAARCASGDPDLYTDDLTGLLPARRPD